MNVHRVRGIALVLTASALWAASGPLTKILRTYSFEITDILAWRYPIGAAAVLIASRVLRPRPNLGMARARLRSAVIMAVGIFAVNAAFTWSNFFTTVANAVALSFTAPLFAAVFGWLLLRERVPLTHRFAIALGLAGIVVFVVGGATEVVQPLSPNIPAGNALALLSGLLFGWYFVMARRLAQRDTDVVAATAWQFLILAVLLLPLALPTLAKPIGAAGYLYLVLYSTLCTAAPILMLNLAGLYLQAHEASILALSEIPFSIVIGMIVVREFPSPVTWLGVGLILTGGALGSRRAG